MDRLVEDTHARSSGTQTATREGLDAMLQLSPDAVVVVAVDGRIVRVNPQARAQFRADIGELEGRPVERLVPAAYQDQHVADRAAFAALPRQRSMGAGRDLEAVRLDGSRFPVDISLQPIDLDGVPLTLAVVRDISAQQALRDANRDLAAHARTLRDFVSLASHELRTPLTAVRGFAETILAGRAHDVAHQQTLLRRIITNADRQEALVAGLLDLTRIQEGKLALEPRWVPVREVVAEVVGSLPDEHIDVQVPDLEVVADPLRLEQVLFNVTINALRYGEPPVSIGAVSEDGDIVLTVYDQGPGVTAAFERVMFDAFQQESVGDQRRSEGLGLGLFLAAQLMHAMDGTISYRRVDGPPTCFDLRIPRAAERRPEGEHARR